MPFYQYAWGAGHGLALAALSNVEDDLYPYTKPRRIAPRSQPVDAFPVRTVLAAGYERGDGRIDHEWQMTLPQAAIEYILDTYLSGGSVVKAAMTINTRKHEFGAYGRYNGYLILPSRRRGDIEYVRQGVFRVTLRFMGLVAL